MKSSNELSGNNNGIDPVEEFAQLGNSSEDIEKNIRLGVINGVLFNTFSSLLDPTLVLVTFVSLLTDSPLLIGLVVPIREGLWYLPQFWISGYLQNQPRKVKMYRWVAIARMISYGMIALSINLFSSPVVTLVVFFIFFTIASFFAGLGGLPFMEIVGKTVPPQRRGEFFALRMGIGGLGSIGASALVKWALSNSSPFVFPHNYGFLAILFFIGASSGLALYMFVKEPVENDVLPRLSFGKQLKRALEILKQNKSYREFIIMQGSYMFAGAAIPFFAIFVQKQLGGDPSMVGIYLAFFTGSNLLSNIVLGRLSRKSGYQNIVLISVCAGLVMLILVVLLGFAAEPLHISARTASLWLIPVFIFSGIRVTGMGVGGNSLLFDLAPPKDRSLYIGFTNSFMGVILLLTGISGVIVDTFGFMSLLVFSLFMNVLAVYSAIKIKKQKIN